MNSAFRALWLVNAEVISKYSSPPSSRRARFLNFRPFVQHKITFCFANYSACVVYTKTIIHLSVGESDGYLPPLRWIIVNYYRDLELVRDRYNDHVLDREHVCVPEKIFPSRSRSWFCVRERSWTWSWHDLLRDRDRITLVAVIVIVIVFAIADAIDVRNVINSRLFCPSQESSSDSLLIVSHTMESNGLTLSVSHSPSRETSSTLLRL